MNEKLLPCPFCGSKVKLSRYRLRGYDGFVEYKIHCTKCGCRISYSKNNTIYNTDEEAKKNAITAWNTRVTEVQS